MAKSACASNYFLISILLAFFLMLYVYASLSLSQANRTKETFAESANALYAPEKVVTIQGVGLPSEAPIQPTVNDSNDPSAPSVDGTEAGPKSKFFFAYNACRLDCCKDAGGYSCSGGCPCFTPQQQKFAGSRGFNSRHSACSHSQADF